MMHHFMYEYEKVRGTVAASALREVDHALGVVINGNTFTSSEGCSNAIEIALGFGDI